MTNIFIFIGLSILTIFVHEFGHYLTAKDQKIYKSITITPLIVMVNLKKPFKSRFDYAFGITLSFLVYPLWLLAGFNPYLVFLILILIGAVDILIMIGWNKPINLGIIKFTIDRNI